MTTDVHINSDTAWIGHKIQEEKKDNRFRIVFNNINGLGSSSYQSAILHLADTQQRLDIDYLGITEHCINVTQLKVHQQLHLSLNKHFMGKFNLQINSGQMVTTTPYLPGGTAALVMGDNIGRLEPRGKNGDDMGRWSYFTFRRNKMPPLTIYTVYQVNPRPTNDIGITAWHQQRLSLDQQDRTTTHPRTAFVEDLISSIKKHLLAHHEIIIGGDFNDTITYNRSNILRIAQATGMTDPWLTMFPAHDGFSTYSRGIKRIDSVLCTPNVLQALRTHSYSPYHWLTNSDHRAIVLEFDEHLLFGCRPNQIPSINLRGIRSNDKKQVSQFIQQWHQHLTENGIFEKIARLSPHSTPHELECIDRIIGQGGDSGEKYCRKRRTTLFSTTLARLRLLTSIMKCNRKELLRLKNPTQILQNRLSRHGILTTLPNTIQEATTQLEQTKIELNQAIQHHRELRQQEQDEKISTALLKKKVNTSRILQTIQRNEARRRTWQILKYQQNRDNTSNQMDRLDIPTSWLAITLDNALEFNTLEDPKKCDNWTTISNPTEIEKYLQIRNRAHFGQAQTTPFTESPFAESLDWAASTDMSETILAGQLHANITDVPQCQALLDTCRVISDLDIIPAIITLEDFKGKIRTWNESTTTSPSGRHLGRYKSLFAEGDYGLDSTPPSEQKAKLIKNQLDIAQSIVSLINTCIITGHTLSRWKTIVNTMIFKDTNNYKIHRLRVIHIYEADFNLLLAIKWRQLLHSAESNNSLHPGLFGGRPGCEAQSLTFLEELKYDISYTSRRTLFNFDNDATSCYDRIIVSFASLINRRYGQHRQIVAIHARTLEAAKFHIRTKLGYSESWYSHSVQYPIYGSGQGSGNSPCIWLFISSTICELHEKVAHGSNFISPDGTTCATISMVGFVDDSTGSCNDFQPQSQQELHQLTGCMQTDAQRWNDLLWCTGGKLELPKCSYHLLHFQFKPSGEPVPMNIPPDTSIQILDAETQLMIPIPAKRADDPHKTLGHWKSPIESKNPKQLQELLKTAMTITTQISTSPLSRYGATLAYFGKYIPTLKYVLPQCFFTPKQLYRMESKTIQPIFAKTGFNRNTALEIRYAPLSLGGCGFIKWFTLQGEGQIQLFLKHWRTNSIISTVLRVALSWSQWQSGLSTPILTDTRTSLPHLECRWIRSLRRFLKHISATIQLDNSYTIRPARAGDLHIMEYAIRCHTFKAEDIKIINYCRSYLHITTISDLFDSAGKLILLHMFQCKRPPWFDTTQIITLQTRPSEYQIRKKWQRFCRELCTADGHLAASLTLGSWTQDHQKNHPHRQTYSTNDDKPRFYHWYQSSYSELLPTLQQGYYKTSTPTTWVPTSKSIPIEVARIPANPHPCYIITHLPTRIISTQIPATTNGNIFEDHCKHLEQWQQTIIPSMNITASYLLSRNLNEANHNQIQLNLIFTSVVKPDKRVTIGWNLTTGHGRILVKQYFSLSSSVSRHRSTHWAHLSGILFLNQYIQAMQIASQQPILLSVISDYSPAIQTYQKRINYTNPYPNATLAKDWDVVEQIHSIYHTSNHRIQATLCYIPLRKRQSTLDYATARLQRHLRSLHQTLAKHPLHLLVQLGDAFIPAARCKLHINKKGIHSQYTRSIREAASIPDLHRYLRRKNTWSSETIKTIQWSWFEKAIAKLSNRNHTHITKLIYDQLPTRTRKNKQGGQSWLPCICRHCDQHPETFDHLLRCNHELGKKFRTNLLSGIKSLCRRFSAPPAFIETITTILQTWFKQTEPRLTPDDSKAYQNLLSSQTALGWSKFMKGFLTCEWQTYLEDLRRQQPRRQKQFDFQEFFSSLIFTIWQYQTTFWHSYQESLHKPTEPDVAIEKITNQHHEIRYLYSLREAITVTKRDEYFPTNLKTFLKTSSPAQLSNYLANYKQPILQSVASEKLRISRLRSIWKFPGFSRRPPRGPVVANRMTRPPQYQPTPPIRPEQTRPDPSRPDTIRPDTTLPTRPNPTRPNPTRTYQTTPTDLTPPDQTSPDPTPQNKRTATNYPQTNFPQAQRAPHKHSKWKHIELARDKFRAFFRPHKP